MFYVNLIYTLIHIYQLISTNEVIYTCITFARITDIAYF